MVFLEQPKDFNPKYNVAGCLIECDENILLLHRQDYKPQGNSWGIPAGKMDPEDKDNAISTLLREVFQETGISLKEFDLKKINTFYVRYPEYDFVYHYYKNTFLKKPEVIINNNEHSNFLWVTPSEALLLPLIPGEDFCMKYAYGIK